MGSAIWEKFPKNKFFLHSHLIIQRHVLCLLHFVFNTCPSTFRPLRRIPIMREGQWRGPLCFFHHDLGDSNRDLWHIWKSYIHGVFNYYQRNIYFKNHKLQMLYMSSWSYRVFFLNWISYCSSYIVSLVVSSWKQKLQLYVFSLFVKIFKLKLKSVMKVLDITLLGLRPRVGIKLWAPLGLHSGKLNLSLKLTHHPKQWCHEWAPLA